MSKVKTQTLAPAKESPPPVMELKPPTPRKAAGRAQASPQQASSSGNGAPRPRQAADILTAPAHSHDAISRAHTMAFMQSALGNTRLSHMMGAPIQTKLTIGAPGDVHEREADRVAEMMMRPEREPVHTPASQQPGGRKTTLARSSIAQRQTASTDANRDEAVGANMEGRIKSPSGGKPLPEGIRREMESGLGTDFSHVRVHDTGKDQADADSLNARAFTHGSDIWLGTGASANDRKLMAHELTHVVQQSGAPAGQDTLTAPTIQRGFFGPTRTNREKIAKALASKDPGDVKDIDDIYEASVNERLALLRILAYQGWAGPLDEYMIEAIWRSFGNQVAQLMSEDTPLWYQCLDVGAELEKLPQVQKLRDQFPIDVKEVVTDYLYQNRKLVLAEMARLGIPADEKAPLPDPTSAQAAEVQNMQVAAAEVAKLQLAQEKARGIFVGYEDKMTRGTADGLPEIDMTYTTVSFNPYKPPTYASWPGMPSLSGDLPKPTPYQEVKTKYDLATKAITGFQALHPALYAVSREGQSATTAAFAQITSPAQARQQLGIAMRKLLNDIEETQRKLDGDELDPLDFIPVHAQLNSGMKAPGSSVKWNERLPEWVAKDLTAEHDFNKVLKSLLLENAAQAAFMLAPFTGGASLFVMLAGLTIAGVKAYQSAEEYENLARAAKTSIIPGTELVTPGQVEQAMMIKEADQIALALAALAVGMAVAGKALGAIKGPASIKTNQPPVKTPAEILMPKGSPVGRAGTSSGIRRLNGGLPEAEKMFNELTTGGKDVTPPGHPGKLVELPNGDRVGLRPVSSSVDKSPSLDINIPGIPINKIHFEP